DRAAAEARADGYTASLDDLELSAEGSGDIRQVTVTALDLTAGLPDESSVRYRWDGTCTTMEVTHTKRYSQSFGYYPFDPDPFDQQQGGSRSVTRFETAVEKVEICTDGRRSVTDDGKEVDLDRFPEETI